MPVLTLKIDVDTYRGTREGVPNLVRLLQRHQADASFLFSLGPDHTGWALRRAFKPGFFQKVSRTSVLEHYGLKTLMYGVLLPAPDIRKDGAAEMRAVRDAGFECGMPYMGSRTVAGQCEAARCRLDRQADATGVRTLHRYLRSSAEGRTAPRAGK